MRTLYYQAAVSFVDGHRRGFAADLHLHALAVDQLHRGEGPVQEHLHLLAGVNGDPLALAGDVDGGLHKQAEREEKGRGCFIVQLELECFLLVACSRRKM